MEAWAIFIAAIALIVAVISGWLQWQRTELLIKDFEERKRKTSKAQLVAEARLSGPSNRVGVVTLTNRGPATAKDIRFTMDGLSAKNHPCLFGDEDDPPELQAGDTFKYKLLIGGHFFDSPLGQKRSDGPWTVEIEWVHEDGEPGRYKKDLTPD